MIVPAQLQVGVAGAIKIAVAFPKQALRDLAERALVGAVKLQWNPSALSIYPTMIKGRRVAFGEHNGVEVDIIHDCPKNLQRVGRKVVRYRWLENGGSSVL